MWSPGEPARDILVQSGLQRVDRPKCPITAPANLIAKFTCKWESEPWSTCNCMSVWGSLFFTYLTTLWLIFFFNIWHIYPQVHPVPFKSIPINFWWLEPTVHHFKVKGPLCPIRTPSKLPIKSFKTCINKALGSFLQENPYIKGVNSGSLGVFCASKIYVRPRSCKLLIISKQGVAGAIH